MARFYAGIGSRETPFVVCTRMSSIANWLKGEGYTLRTGDAEGADAAFWQGAGQIGQMFKPWPKQPGGYEPVNRSWGVEIAKKYHPAWDRLTHGGKALMGRNTFQVLGPTEHGPVSQFVVCWTKDGKASGGTGQAIRIAAAYHIKVFNLHDPDAEASLRQYMDRIR